MTKKTNKKPNQDNNRLGIFIAGGNTPAQYLLTTESIPGLPIGQGVSRPHER